MNKTVLYTVITNGYDTPIPVTPSKGIDYIMFTDDATLQCQGWNIIHTKENQRHIKVLPPKEVLKYEQSVYVDGNITPIKIPQFLSVIKDDLFIFQHPIRNCFIQEHYACIKHNKADHDLIRKQLCYNIELGLEPEKGMYQAGVIFRKHTDEVLNFCKCWLEELKKFTHRDQLSLMTAVHITYKKISASPWSNFSKFFKLGKHKPKEKPNIYYFVPYNTDGNIGVGLNKHCELVPNDDDWIVIRDGDTMFQNPRWGLVVEESIMSYGHQYQLIGAVTNRVGGVHQCIGDMFGEMSLYKHWEVSEKLESSNVEPTSGVAGFFMAFKKSTWLKAGKFTENKSLSHRFDTEFNNAVRKIGGNIGMMTGVYVTHSYRIWEGDDRDKSKKSVKHLF